MRAGVSSVTKARIRLLPLSETVAPSPEAPGLPLLPSLRGDLCPRSSLKCEEITAAAGKTREHSGTLRNADGLPLAPILRGTFPSEEQRG